MTRTQLGEVAEQLARAWVIAALAMVGSGIAAWPLSFLLGDVPYTLATVVFLLAPSLSLAWSVVVIYRAVKGRTGAA